MSWLSSAWDSVKSVGSKVLSVAKKVVTPLASFAVGLVPGVGPLLSKGVDMLGNTLIGDDADPSSDAGAAAQTPIADMLTQSSGVALAMTSSPAAQALASATSTSSDAAATSPGWVARVTGIGDGKPGVLGIGTGKNKAAKAAAASGEYQPGTATPEYSPTSSSGASGGIIAAAAALLGAALFL